MVADSISHKQWVKFREAAPHARRQSCQVHQSVIISSLNCFKLSEAFVSKNTHKSNRGELAVSSKLCSLLKCMASSIATVQLVLHSLSSGLAFTTVRSYLCAISFLSKLQNTLDPRISCFKLTARNETKTRHSLSYQ